jgi:hypothetical protein
VKSAKAFDVFFHSIMTLSVRNWSSLAYHVRVDKVWQPKYASFGVLVSALYSAAPAGVPVTFVAYAFFAFLASPQWIGRESRLIS